MHNSFKYFFSSLNSLVSKSFFYSQSKFSDILKDRLYGFIKRKLICNNNEFISVSGFSDISVPIFELELSTERGNSVSAKSLSYTTEIIPDIFHDIILKNRNIIENYLGKGFLYEAPLFFRTKNIPSEYINYDIYSNVWHQDSHDGDLLLKIFILLKDVSENDGPFIFLERKDTIKYWKDLCDRWSFSKFKAIPTFSEEKKVVGKKGDYVIINTSNCMHRASIPDFERDMAQIALYPNWRKKSDRNIYKF